MGESITVLADLFNAAVTANADILGSTISASNAGGALFRIYATFDQAGVLTVRRKNGATTVSENLNAGGSLVANAAYIFDVAVTSGDQINLRFSATGNALSLVVMQIEGDS